MKCRAPLSLRCSRLSQIQNLFGKPSQNRQLISHLRLVPRPPALSSLSHCLCPRLISDWERLIAGAPLDQIGSTVPDSFGASSMRRGSISNEPARVTCLLVSSPLRRKSSSNSERSCFSVG